jgi:transposase
MAAQAGRGVATGTPRRRKNIRGSCRTNRSGDDPKTGEVREASVFVAVLGASNYTYAEATWTKDLWDWIGSHVRAFEFFDGTSRLVVPDNWRTGVKAACYYEPELNRTYADLATHYGIGILPARPYRPRDKAKAEAGVQIVQRWVLAALRKRRFFSLADLNEAIAELMVRLNQRPFRKMPGSRADLYQSIDRADPAATARSAVCFRGMEESKGEPRLSH